MEMTVIADALRWLLAGAAHALPTAFQAFSRAAAPIVVTAAWQGAAVACGLAICLRFARRAPAAHRFVVWAAGFAAVLALPFLPMLLNFGARAAGGVSASVVAAPPKPWLQLDIRWSLGLGALWIAASIWRALDLGLHSLRLRRLWRTAVPVAPGDLPDLLPSVLPSGSAAPWRRRPIQVCTTRDLDRPSVIGFWAPRILIPDWLLPRLTRDELEQVALHETEHLRRRDDWTNLLQKLCLLLFPLNPALIWIERRLCREREMACDDGVVRVTRAPRAYAACLANLAERGHDHILERRAHALSLGAWRRRPELAQRVHRILKRTPGLSPLATNALLVALGCGLVFGSVEFASCPQLIAFVPARSAAAPRQPASAGTPGRPAQMLNASPGRSARTKIVRIASRRQSVKAVAIPAAGRAFAAATRIAAHRAPARSSSAREWETALIGPRAGQPRQELLKAEIPASRPAAGLVQHPVQAQEWQAQEWIVLTTWEQVQASTQADAQMAGGSAGAGARHQETPAETQAGVRPSGEPRTRISVTRLIFRVYPAFSVSTSAAAVPFSNGWLVIQL